MCCFEGDPLGNVDCTDAYSPNSTFGPDPYRVRHSYNSTRNILTIENRITWYTNWYSYYSSKRYAVTNVDLTGGPYNTYAYNANGEMTSRTVSGTSSTIAFDALHQVTTVTTGGNVTFNIYDAAGQRLLRKDPGAVTTLYLEGQEIQATSGVATSASRYYAHGAMTVAMRRQTSTTNTLYWLAGDQQGSLQWSVNQTTGAVSRQRYTPFGAPRGAANQLPGERGFLGQTEDDSTALVYLNARYYDPSIGRFISADPLVQSAPQACNPFSYSGNNPKTMSDPTGLAATPGDAGPIRTIMNCSAQLSGYDCFYDVEMNEFAYHDDWAGCSYNGDRYGCWLASAEWMYYFVNGEYVGPEPFGDLPVSMDGDTDQTVNDICYEEPVGLYACNPQGHSDFWAAVSEYLANTSLEISGAALFIVLTCAANKDDWDCSVGIGAKFPGVSVMLLPGQNPDMSPGDCSVSAVTITEVGGVLIPYGGEAGFNIFNGGFSYGGGTGTPGLSASCTVYSIS